MNRTILINMLSNNLKALAIHVCICLILVLPIGIIFFYGVWSDSMWERWTLSSIVTQWLLVVVITLIALVLYFVIGRKYLVSTCNVLTNIFSVIVLPGIIILLEIIAWSDPSRIGVLDLMMTTIYPVSETLYYFLRIERAISYMVMSLLPPIAMWLGMVTKPKNSKPIDFDQPF